MAGQSLTFAVDLLAHTTYSPVLNSPVTTINVKERVLDQESAAAQKSESGNRTESAGRPAAAGKVAAPLAHHGLHPLHILVNRWLRHIVCR